MNTSRHIPGSPEVKVSSFHCEGCGFNSGGELRVHMGTSLSGSVAKTPNFLSRGDRV